MPKKQIGANVCQKYCSKLSYWPPEDGLGLKSCDHVQVGYLESALIEDRSWNWERNKFWEARLTFYMTFCQQKITFSHTDAGVSAKKRERDHPQMWASSAYILVWADRWKVQFSAILNDNWIKFKIESVCQHSEHLNVTFWFIIQSLVLDLWAKWYQIQEKNLIFWHSYYFKKILRIFWHNSIVDMKSTSFKLSFGCIFKCDVYSKVCNNCVQSWRGNTNLVDRRLPPHFLAGQRFPIGSSTCR